MASKRDIINDIRTIYPNAVTLCKEEIKRLLRKGDAAIDAFLQELTPMRVGKRNEYLIIDIADKIHRMCG